MRRLAIGRPSCVCRISGSAPRLPIRITLLTLPAMFRLSDQGVQRPALFERRPRLPPPDLVACSGEGRACPSFPRRWCTLRPSRSTSPSGRECYRDSTATAAAHQSRPLSACGKGPMPDPRRSSHLRLPRGGGVVACKLGADRLAVGWVSRSKPRLLALRRVQCRRASGCDRHSIWSRSRCEGRAAFPAFGECSDRKGNNASRGCED
jgi:hypothetical protein